MLGFTGGLRRGRRRQSQSARFLPISERHHPDPLGGQRHCDGATDPARSGSGGGHRGHAERRVGGNVWREARCARPRQVCNLFDRARAAPGSRTAATSVVASFLSASTAGVAAIAPKAAAVAALTALDAACPAAAAPAAVVPTNSSVLAAPSLVTARRATLSHSTPCPVAAAATSPAARAPGAHHDGKSHWGGVRRPGKSRRRRWWSRRWIGRRPRRPRGPHYSARVCALLPAPAAAKEAAGARFL
jgi:hypothetical protein